VVRFDPAEFVAVYPAFATLSNAQMQAAFDVAAIFLNNSCCSVVQDANLRQRLLYMATAHVCALIYGENGKPPAGIVGRVDKAAEGTVSVSASYASEMSMSEAYFSQTPYGAMFWQATVAFRSMAYFPPPADACVGGIPGYGFGGAPWGSWPGGGCGPGC
jgi:hypothetical protein